MKNIFIGIIVLLSTNAFASDGSSGCGPGWYLFKKNSLVSSSLRATTNGVLYPVVTIGMTFGTSNCTRHSIVKKEKESLHFVTHNRYELQSEVAKGHGEYVSALAETIGCMPGAKSHFINKLQDNYEKIFSNNNSTPDAILLETYKIIFSDKTLFQQCALPIG